MSAKEYTNKHLLEVVCGFNFIENAIKWDSAYFGQYFDQIKSLGFTERQERKGVQFQLQDNQKDLANPLRISTKEVESTMLFKNPSNNYAITMGRNQISFHRVAQYNNWADFMNLLIAPGIKYYNNLGLYHEKKNCQVIYLNRFDFDAKDDLSEYFKFLTPAGTEFGIADNTIIHRTFNYQNQLLLVLKLNANILPNGRQQVNMECAAISTNQELNESTTWDKLANIVHEPIRNFFESLITDKLINDL